MRGLCKIRGHKPHCHHRWRSHLGFCSGLCGACRDCGRWLIWNGAAWAVNTEVGYDPDTGFLGELNGKTPGSLRTCPVRPVGLAAAGEPVGGSRTIPAPERGSE